jgi:uridine kinase
MRAAGLHVAPACIFLSFTERGSITMNNSPNHQLEEHAWKVIEAAAQGYGIKASAITHDNYNRVWARDAVVTGLAILVNEKKSLYPSFLQSLQYLQKAAAPNGQIPSNVSIDSNGNITAVSYGGPVGRTDCSFWWTIGAINYLRRVNEDSLKSEVLIHTEKIFKLAESWEFNYQGLMHLPVSSNWADEYITGGYVLYDQLLRYWALYLAGDFFGRKEWSDQAIKIKISIKKHFCLEAELNQSLFTAAQREQLKSFQLSEGFISSFTATQIIKRYDCWSIALLILLNIPSEATVEVLWKALEKEWKKTGAGIPAFWPVIDEKDPYFEQLLYNHSYRFKNKPGHFHNGGIWPVTNSFLITALFAAGKPTEARQLLKGLSTKLNESVNDHPFPEYFDLYQQEPQGVNQLCYSASGYLLAQKAASSIADVMQALGLNMRVQWQQAETNARATAGRIIEQLAIPGSEVLTITIAGESGCGKTTLGRAMEQEFSLKGYKTLLFHQDDYFKLPPKQNHQQRVDDFSKIGVEEVSLDKLDEDIRKIKQQTENQLTIPVMNWVTDTREFKQIDIRDVQIVIIEGTYTTLLREADHRIFMSASHEQTKQNRINRNRETVTEFIERVLEKESGIIQSHRPLADIVLTPDGSLLLSSDSRAV